jgi:hypothetical protein
LNILLKWNKLYYDINFAVHSEYEQ